MIQSSSQQVAGHNFQGAHLKRVGLASGPFFYRTTGHAAYIGPRFARKRSAADQPVAHTTRSGIVRGCRKAKVAKFTTQITQELSRLGNRFKRIEWVFKVAQSCGCRHELGYALCTCPADCIRLKATFLPDQAGEEIGRQIVARCLLRYYLTQASWCCG